MHLTRSIILKLLLVIILITPTLMLSTPVSAADTLYDEYWLASPDQGTGFENSSDYLRGQTFIPALTHDVSAVEIMLRLDAVTSPCNVTLSIKATDAAGNPTGPDLVSKTLDCSGLPIGTPTAQTFSFSTPYIQIQAGVKYAIVAYEIGYPPNLFLIGQNHDINGPDDYPYGTGIYSNNGGADWSSDNLVDFHFRVYGTEDLGYDYGDAPTSYPTLAANNGARCGINPNFYLGSLIDAESDGLPNATATGDDLNNLDDEDGVTISTPWYRDFDLSVNVKLTSSVFARGYLTAWVDKDQDGVWETSERVFYRTWLDPGDNQLTLNLYNTLLGTTYARFRVSPFSNEELTPGGNSLCGEVEDYQLEISDLPSADLAVTTTGLPDRTLPGQELHYEITAANNGPNNATDIEVSSTIPSGVTFKSADYAIGTFNSSSGVWSGFGLLNGEQAQLDLTATVDSATPGTILRYQVEIEGAVLDPSSNNNYDYEQITVGIPRSAGGEAAVIDKVSVLLPWLAIALAITIWGVVLGLRRRKES